MPSLHDWGAGKLNFYSRVAIILYLIPLPPYAKCQMRFWKAIMFCPLHSMTIFWAIAKVFQFCRSHISTMYFGTFLFVFQLFLVAKREVLVLRQLIHKRECILDKFCIIEFCWYLWASEAEQNFQICVKKINFHTKGYDSYRVSS